MITAGCDVGSTTVKAVVIADGQVVCGPVVRSLNPELTSAEAMEGAIREAGLSMSVEALDVVVSTGYGRIRVPFADKHISEISCHGKGARWFFPTVRTVVDIGGQDMKVIQLNEKGKMVDFAMNDRCAAGTGRFFEGMARVLGCGLEGISAAENMSDTPATITNQCTVFAESEVVTLLNEGGKLPDIITGINHSVANRVYSMARKVGLVADLVISGGCSKNSGLLNAIEKKLGMEVKKSPVDPQFLGAIGAALFAKELMGETRL